MRLTYFYSSEISESVELKNKILSLPVSEKLNINLINSESDSFSQLGLLIACHRDDIVIIDCTIPNDKSLKTVFPILVAQVNMLDHVIVVSNTMLPLNITPIRKGYDSPRFKSDFTKEKQVRWVNEQIEDLYRLISSGLHYNRLSIEGYKDLEKSRPEMENMYLESDKFIKAQSKHKKKVLISYRNSHFEEVFAYKKNYEKIHPDTIVRMVEPGVLCSGEETLTPMRKWMLTFMLEERIHDIDELIVYKTPDYTDSWWTCAELVMVAYNNYRRDEAHKIKIKYHNPNDDVKDDSDVSEWLMPFVLNDSQNRRLARLAANTRPDTMGPECMSNIDQMRTVAESISNSNFIVRSFLKWSIKNMLKKSIPASLSKEEKKEMLDKTIELYTDKDALEKYLSDEIFLDAFWQKLSYQVDWPTPAFVYNNENKKFEIDIDAFLHAPMNEIIDYSSDELSEKAEKAEKINVNSSTGTKNLNVYESSNKRYIWLATRMGKPTVKDDNMPGLEEFRVFELSEK